MSYKIYGNGYIINIDILCDEPCCEDPICREFTIRSDVKKPFERIVTMVANPECYFRYTMLYDSDDNPFSYYFEKKGANSSSMNYDQWKDYKKWLSGMR